MSDTERPQFYITTAIPYVNASPHIGFALELVQADTIARYHRLRGEDVFFQTGADENALKNVQAAEAEGLPTRDLVDRNSGRFVDLCKTLEISNDKFMRTVSTEHFDGVEKLWRACRPEDIYKKSYKGLYCVGCETFYTEDELTDGKCPEHDRAPERVEEENYFFRLSAYQDRLEELIASGAYEILPETRRNEVLSFIRMGLKDFSISRSQERARGWGVPVPDDPSQVVYVWFDALGNYITGLDYAHAEDDPDGLYRYWPADTHLVGKGIIRFHAVYWPAMLMSAGLPLPRRLFVHGYINLGGAKMSKSLGTVVDPTEVVGAFGAEPTRHYLIRHVHTFQDSDFSADKLAEAYNADLANGIGNLLSRSLTLIEKHCDATLRVVPCEGDDERALRETFDAIFAQYEGLMDRCEMQQAMNKVWEGVAALDRYINEKKPWALAKDTEQRGELECVLCTLAEGLRMLASMIAPVMPETAAEIWRRLGMEREWASVAWDDHRRWGLLPDGATVAKGAPLFPRLDRPKTPQALST